MTKWHADYREVLYVICSNSTSCAAALSVIYRICAPAAERSSSTRYVAACVANRGTSLCYLSIALSPLSHPDSPFCARTRVPFFAIFSVLLRVFRLGLQSVPVSLVSARHWFRVGPHLTPVRDERRVELLLRFGRDLWRVETKGCPPGMAQNSVPVKSRLETTVKSLGSENVTEKLNC